jgi:hypothetical protein
MRVLLGICAIVLMLPVLLVVAIALGPAAWALAGIGAVTACVLCVINLARAYARHTRIAPPRG